MFLPFQNGANSRNCNGHGPQLFTGPTSAPVLTPGVFPMTSGTLSVNGSLVFLAGTVTATAVPEPASFGLAVLALVAIYAVFDRIGNAFPAVGIDSHWSLLLAYSGGIALHVWTIKGYYDTIPVEIEEAAKVDGCSFFQRFRHIVTPMIFPILMIGFLFDTVFTLSDLSVVYLLTQGGPGSATQILPVLAYQIGIQAGSLGRGAAIALMLVPLLFPALFLMLRNLKRRDW